MLARYTSRALAAHVDWSTGSQLLRERRLRARRTFQAGAATIMLGAAGLGLLGWGVTHTTARHFLAQRHTAGIRAPVALATIPMPLASQDDSGEAAPSVVLVVEDVTAALAPIAELAVQPPLNAVPSGAPTGPWPFRVNVSRWQPTVEGELSAARMTQGIDQAVTTELLLAMIAAESHGDPRAVSQARAVGLMQLMPNTFADHVKGADPFDPGMNVRAGLLYLNRALSAHDGDLEWALAGYHAGIGASLHARAGDDELWTETIRYVYGVLALRDSALVMRGKQPPPRAGSLKPAEVLTIAAVGR